MADDSKPPVSRFRRALRLGRLAARVGGRLALGASKTKEALVADDLVETLGSMRGAPQKLGQMLSYVHQDLPTELRARLAHLQADGDPMPLEDVDGVLLAELGGSASALFGTFESDPLAVASIGQVHRATTRGGRDVVVKVQFPGVEESIRADLSNTGPILRLGAMAFPQADPRALREELLSVMLQECD